jgi:hypothetical protein
MFLIKYYDMDISNEAENTVELGEESIKAIRTPNNNE